MVNVKSMYGLDTWLNGVTIASTNITVVQRRERQIRLHLVLSVMIQVRQRYMALVRRSLLW